MWTAYKTIVIKEVLRFSRIWVQTIFPPVILVALYLLIFGGLIGQRIGAMGGVDYLHFIIPGIILMTVITNSYANTASSFYISKFNRSVEELLVSPVPYWVILLGYVSGAMVRGLSVGAVGFLTVWIFTDFTVDDYFIVAVIFLLTTLFFATAGFINGIFAKSFDDISIVPTFVLMPLTYLGGMFYTIDILPAFWRQVSAFNPIFYMVDGFRLGFLGHASQPFLFSLTVLALMVITLLAVAFRLFKNHLESA